MEVCFVLFSPPADGEYVKFLCWKKGTKQDQDSYQKQFWYLANIN